MGAHKNYRGRANGVRWLTQKWPVYSALQTRTTIVQFLSTFWFNLSLFDASAEGVRKSFTSFVCMKAAYSAILFKLLQYSSFIVQRIACVSIEFAKNIHSKFKRWYRWDFLYICHGSSLLSWPVCSLQFINWCLLKSSLNQT